MIVRMKTINKILYIIICIIIIAGIIVWKYNGFNLELQYSNRDQINISNNTGINIEDIKKDNYNVGYNDGISDGKYDMQIEIVKRLKKANIDDDLIIEVTNINPLELKELDITYYD